MTRTIMYGCNGHMGRVVSDLAEADPDVQIVAGIDICTDKNYDYPVWASFGECTVDADVTVDFSLASALGDVVQGCKDRGIALVECTTGLKKSQEEDLLNAAGSIPILRSANMSLGVNLLLDILGRAARILYPADFDVEIVERHHNLKKDAPSGTAYAMADAINDALGGDMTYVFDRSSLNQSRTKKEIGLSSVRGGNIVGQHEVIFAGRDEVIEFKHTATSKGVFAAGALQAAKFLVGKQPGMYDMSDVIKARM